MDINTNGTKPWWAQDADVGAGVKAVAPNSTKGRGLLGRHTSADSSFTEECPWRGSKNYCLVKSPPESLSFDYSVRQNEKYTENTTIALYSTVAVSRKSTCIFGLGLKSATVFMEHHSDLKDSLTDNHVFIFGYLAGISSKINKMSLLLQREQQIWGNLYLTPWTWQLPDAYRLFWWNWWY